jgi:hypothetical protein
MFSYVPNSVIKYILTQPDNEGRRGKWISKMQEYDLEIKPTKLVKRQGMAKLMARSNYQAISLNIMTTNIMGAGQK